MLAHFQPARRARCDLGHRARGVHLTRALAGKTRRAGLFRVAREALASDAEAGGNHEEDSASFSDVEENAGQGAEISEPARGTPHPALTARRPLIIHSFI